MKILIADDQPLDRAVLRLSLEKWDYEVVEAADGNEAMKILQSDDAPNLAILDWMMPGVCGPDICREIRGQDRPRYTYILLLTSKDDKDDLVEGMKSGADDYIVKPVNVHELNVRLRAGRRIVELHEELIATREELRFQATRDFLTGIWNRAVITEKLNEEVQRAARRSENLGVIMCDIDHFKKVNDTYGHPAGDAVLVTVTERMQECLRAYDSLGRYGGEEFLIVTPDVELDGAMVVAERIRQSIVGTPIEAAGESLQITLSLGATVCSTTPETRPDELIEAADKALYRAKEGGRNRVELIEFALDG